MPHSIVDVQRLAWSDPDLGSIDLPKKPLKLRAGFGSGLSRRRGDPPDTLWAVGDRGPNLKVSAARELYGLTGLEDQEGAKIMPRLDIGPAIAELRVHADRVELVRTIRLHARGKPISGLPIPASEHAQCEPALDLEGKLIEPDSGGADTEGIVALSDGSFWVGDEYGPSLLKLSAEGEVLFRWMPAGAEDELAAAPYPVTAGLPAVAARRQLNRGFEALTVSADESWLYLAFQSPLAHPGKAAHEQASHVRIWRLDASTGAVAAQFVYPLDPPKSFHRDKAKGAFGRSDIKVSEITCLGKDRLLVLERGSETTKFYLVLLEDALAVPPEHLEVGTRPTLEELSAQGSFPLPVLAKELVFSTDDLPQIGPDLEGMVLLSPSELLLVNDNDFGVEGAETEFWRVTFAAPLADG